MTAHSLSARLAVAFCRWLLTHAGVEFHLGPVEPAGHNLRDKRGRFRPKEGGGYGLPRDVPHQVADLLFEMGVTAEMYKTAAVALQLPADFEDVEALQLCLREWIYRNMDHWVNGQRRGVWGVMQALMHTWAIALYKYKPPRRFLRANRHDATTPREDSHAVDLSHRSERFQRVADCKQNAESNVGEGLAPSRYLADHHNVDTWVGAGPAPARVDVRYDVEMNGDTDAATTGKNLRELRALRDLRGEENTFDTPTTAGGRKALPYAVGDTATHAARAPNSEPRYSPRRGPPHHQFPQPSAH